MRILVTGSAGWLGRRLMALLARSEHKPVGFDVAPAKRRLGWRARTDFAAVLRALREGHASPVAHDPAYLSPKER